MVFVSFNDNYGDEFDINGFAFYNNKEEFLLDLYKTWLYDYLESGSCSVLEKYLEENDIDFEDYFEKATIKELERFLKQSNNYYREENKEFYFGTNEAIIYECFKDFKNCFKIKEVTKDEYEIIKKIIGEEYGVFPISY